MTWLQETLKFRPISTPIHKINLSILTVELDAGLTVALKPDLGLPEIAAEHFRAINGAEVKVVLGRMDFIIERPMSERTIPTLLQRLVLEQRGNTVPEQRRYYSSAPLATSDHVAALEAINAKLSG